MARTMDPTSKATFTTSAGGTDFSANHWTSSSEIDNWQNVYHWINSQIESEPSDRSLRSSTSSQPQTAALASVHRELAADDRPDLIYVNFQPRYAREGTTGGAHSAEKFFPGDLLAVTRLGRLPSTTAEHFVRSHEGALQIEKHNFWTVLQYTLVKRTVASHTISYCARKQRGKNVYQIFASDFPVPVNVPTRFYSSEEGLRPGNFYRTTILTPQAHPAALLNNIKPGAAKQYVVRATNPLALRHKYRPTLMSATAPTAEDTRLLSLARNPYGTVDISNADALKSLLFAGRLAISAAIALTHRKTDSNFYTVTVDNVVPHFRGSIMKFKISHAGTAPSPESWSRDTPFFIETTAGESIHCKVLTMDNHRTHLQISARAINGLNLEDLLENEVFVSQSTDYAVHDLRNFPTMKVAIPLNKEHHAFHYLPALFGGRPLEQNEVNAPPITTERGVMLTHEQAEFIARFKDRKTHAFLCDASFGTGKTYTVTYATADVALEKEGPQPLQIIFTPTNAAAHAAYNSFIEHDPLKKIPALRLISAKNRDRIDASLRTEYDTPEVLGKLFWTHVKDYDAKHPVGPVNDAIVLSAIFYARSLYHGNCKPLAAKCSNPNRKEKSSEPSTGPAPSSEPSRPSSTPSREEIGVKWPTWCKPSLWKKRVKSHGTPSSRSPPTSRGPAWLSLVTPDNLTRPIGMPDQLRTLGIDSMLTAAVNKVLIPRTNLRTVFRCPHEITSLLSKTFYESKLEPKPKEPPSGLAAELGIGTEDGLYTVDLAYPEIYMDPGYRNTAEADIAEALARRALNSNKFRTVGVITIYKAQCSELAARLETTRAYTGTADASQGKEFDLTIVLTTRTATPTPFACEFDRANVALSRTKKILVVIANHAAASQRKPWRQILSNLPHRHTFAEQSIRRILNVAEPPPPSRQRRVAVPSRSRLDNEN
uniref:AAA_12 domain-containing protein n=1 Tax=Caenorhabditis japonica TaxID=281687 RepID=A0A8R1E637_CAEJA